MTQHPIEIYRRARGLSRSDLATALQISHVTVWRWEKQEFKPDRETLKRVARFFGVAPIDLDPSLAELMSTPAEVLP